MEEGESLEKYLLDLVHRGYHAGKGKTQPGKTDSGNQEHYTERQDFQK